MIGMQKDSVIDTNKRQQDLKLQQKRIHSRNYGINPKNSRLASIRGANNTKRPRCTYRMEDYLEIIYELVQHKGYATLADVAEYLNVRPPSVTTMMRRLDQNGLLNYEKYRGIQLTERGVDIAMVMHQRHSVVSEFLKIIGVSDRIANIDAERMEHHLHPQTMHRLTELMHRLKVSNNND